MIENGADKDTKELVCNLVLDGRLEEEMMELYYNEYLISNNKSLISADRVCELLSQSYWANTRSREKIELSIKNSICIGVYKSGTQVGFARIITDYATMYWLCDVIIDEEHRGKGLGKQLMGFIGNIEELKGLRGILSTKDAHGLYEQNGYRKDGEHFMVR